MLEAFQLIKVFIFDVDGVLTNSQLLITENGELLRSMNTRDGYALKKAAHSGYQVVIITGGSSQGVVDRLKGLGIEDVKYKIVDKLSVYNALQEQYQWKTEEVLFMGDDIPDLVVMEKVGLAACPADATEEIKAISHYVSPLGGGKGCVRDVIEKVLKLNNHWQDNGTN